MGSCISSGSRSCSNNCLNKYDCLIINGIDLHYYKKDTKFDALKYFYDYISKKIISIKYSSSLFILKINNKILVKIILFKYDDTYHAFLIEDNFEFMTFDLLGTNMYAPNEWTIINKFYFHIDKNINKQMLYIYFNTDIKINDDDDFDEYEDC